MVDGNIKVFNIKSPYNLRYEKDVLPLCENVFIEQLIVTKT